MKVNLKELFVETIFSEEILKEDEPPEIVIENVDNSSSTSDLYKQRSSYKEQVNDKNLPIGNKNSLGQNLNNQLDTWYKRPNYAKYNNKGKLIVSTAAANLTKFESGFELLDFVADATEEFFRQYNVVRNPHPESRLNNITILRAYEREPNYNEYLNKIYENFFNDILDPIKHSNQIKDIKDFINLFYNWFIDQDAPFTRVGFIESNQYSIYNTGLAFDFFNVQSEKDKAAILNDVRWSVLNYVAKVNGLRVDPNNPGTLIADIRSSKLIEKYAVKYFQGEQINDIPEKILERYFKRVNAFNDSSDILQEFTKDFIEIYNRFAEKYSSFTDFNAEDDVRQLFKKKFQTNKVERKRAEMDDFTKLRNDEKQEIDKYIIKIYVKMRLKENNITINSKQMNKLINNLSTVQSTISGKSFIDNSTFVEKIYTNAQPLNVLEAFIASQKDQNGDNKKGYVFLWDDGKRQSLTGTEEFATLVQEDEEGLVFSEAPEDANPFSS